MTPHTPHTHTHSHHHTHYDYTLTHSHHTHKQWYTGYDKWYGCLEYAHLCHWVILSYLPDYMNYSTHYWTHSHTGFQCHELWHTCAHLLMEIFSFLYTWTSAWGGGGCVLTGPSIKGSSQVGSKEKPVRRHGPELHTTVWKGGALQHSTREKYCIPCSLL